MPSSASRCLTFPDRGIGWICSSSIGGVRVPIELKYWQFTFEHTTPHGEPFRMVNQSAQDMHRAAFAKDIMRIEELVDHHRSSEGWVVALTNDPSYWSQGRGGGTSDEAFRLNEGRTIGGRLVWRAGTSISTSKGTTEVDLRGSYVCRWADYSAVTPARGGRFRFLAIKVT